MSPRVKKPSAAVPDLAAFDQQHRVQAGVTRLGGVDEAGRGALAGPVVAACVVLEPGCALPGLNDSKLLTAAAREALVAPILERAAAWGVGWASAAEIDQINILQATLRAAGRALALLPAPPELLLTDFLKLPAPPCPCRPIVDGDAQSQAIAAASILAKVARDRIMIALAAAYPQYGLAAHKGYGTAAHWAALETHGPSTLHRLTFRGVCFFNAAPRVRSAVHPPAPDGAMRPAGPLPAPDWRALLTAPSALALDPAAFLPEAERDF